MRLLVLVAACLAAGCGSSVESLEGKVVLQGQTDHGGVLVFASGRLFSEDSVSTGPDGTWHFRIGGSGARYFVKAYAPSTLEKTQEIVLDIGDHESKVAPDIVFTPIGTARGTITAQHAPVEGARVVLEGTDLGATTDAAGAFAFDAVRTGTYTLRVEVDGHAPATVKGVAIAYAKSTDVGVVDVP